MGACTWAINISTEKVVFQRNQKISFEKLRSHVWISSEQVGGDGGEMAEGSTGVDLQAEDCGALPGSVRQDAPQDRPGQKHPLRSHYLEWRGKRKERCFCLLR